MKVRFLLCGAKGLDVLETFFFEYGKSAIEQVVIGEDSNVDDDCSDLLLSFCRKWKISYIIGSSDYGTFSEDVYTFAIGWRFLLPVTNKLIIFHDSLLPKNRGFAPLVGSLVEGEKTLGVTALFASEFYDRGEIIAQKQIDVEYPLTILQAIRKIKGLYSQLVCDLYAKLSVGAKLTSVLQEEREATYSLWLDDQDYYINWNWPASKIKRFIDATGYPYGGAKSFAGSRIIKIIDALEIDDVVVRSRERHIGKVIFRDEKSMTVVCGSGLLRIFELTDEQGEPVKLNFRTRFH